MERTAHRKSLGEKMSAAPLFSRSDSASQRESSKLWRTLEPHEMPETKEVTLQSLRLPPILVPEKIIAEAVGTAELVSSRCSCSAAQLAPLQLLIPAPHSFPTIGR